MALFATLKIKLPSLYDSLLAGKISAIKFYHETNLNQLKLGHEHSFNWEWMKAHLDWYLMSDDELKKATENANASNGDLRQVSRDMGGNRTKTIPFFCSSLNRFSIKP